MRKQNLTTETRSHGGNSYEVRSAISEPTVCSKLEVRRSKLCLLASVSPWLSFLPMTADPPPLLAIEDLQSAYGLSRVLFGISLDIAAGECVCLLGRNGVGKTTTMRSVMGLLRPTAGRVVWKGTDIAGWARARPRHLDLDGRRRGKMTGSK